MRGPWSVTAALLVLMTGACRRTEPRQPVPDSGAAVTATSGPDAGLELTLAKLDGFLAYERRLRGEPAPSVRQIQRLSQATDGGDRALEEAYAGLRRRTEQAQAAAVDAGLTTAEVQAMETLTAEVALARAAAGRPRAGGGAPCAGDGEGPAPGGAAGGRRADGEAAPRAAGTGAEPHRGPRTLGRRRRGHGARPGEGGARALGRSGEVSDRWWPAAGLTRGRGGCGRRRDRPSRTPAGASWREGEARGQARASGARPGRWGSGGR